MSEFQARAEIFENDRAKLAAECGNEFPEEIQRLGQLVLEEAQCFRNGTCGLEDRMTCKLMLLCHFFRSRKRGITAKGSLSTNFSSTSIQFIFRSIDFCLQSATGRGPTRLTQLRRSRGAKSTSTSLPASKMPLSPRPIEI